MRLIQLSDIHLSEDNISTLKNYYLDALKKDLSKFHDETPVDLILITGDLIDKGGESFQDKDPYQIFEREFIEPILQQLSLTKDKVLFIPGNHDIERNEVEETYEEGLLTKLKTVDAINNQVDKQTSTFSLANNRIKRFKEFEKQYHRNTANYYLTNNESVFIYENDGVKIGLLLINDSWRCSKDLKTENHVVGINQLFNAKMIFDQSQTAINLVLFHHPIDCISEIERQEIKNILQKFDFELVLCGHKHRFNFEGSSGVNGNVVFLNSKSAFNNPREENGTHQPGYSIIDIDTNTLALTCYFRAYMKGRYEFDKDTSSSENGEWKGKLIARGDKKNYYDLYELATKTVTSHQDDFNNALVIFKTNSIAPKDVNSIFVLPKLTDKPTTFGTFEDLKRYSLSELILDERHILLFGNKEAGKSTLLNRISIETSQHFSRFKKIPIVVDYKKLEKGDVVGAIKHYLNESKEKIVELATQGQILLLIDNIDESAKLEYAKKHIQHFLNEFPNNKIIGTTSASFDEMLQNEKSLLVDLKLKPIFIGLVGVNEFRQLATKWFNTRDKEWQRNNIEKLIKVFEILRIPRTFFAVSLFLWIIEKQEDFKPINKNYLLNKFLGYILEGLVQEEGKAGSFSFERKKEMLSEIAFEMYEKGNELENYSLSKDEIIVVIKKYCEKNQRSFDPENAFNLFNDKGIFKTDSQTERILFRFESFFQFFLSLNIETNPDFKKKVFSDEEVLSFIDELDYFSGRHPNDKAILEYSITLLQKSFSEIDRFIDDDTDKYFPKKSFILSKLDPNTFAPELRKSKLTDEEIDTVLDNQMEMLPIDDSIKLKQRYHYLTHFNRALELAARILKNAENIQDASLVNQSLDLIVQKSAKYGIFLQSIIASHFRKQKESIIPIPPDMLISIAPMINQLLLLSWIGTEFLQVPLEKKIKKYSVESSQKKKPSHDYERFLTCFVYADLRLHDYMKYTDEAIKHIDNKYFAELYFFKVLIHYMMRPEKSELLPELETQMIILLTKARGWTTEQAKNIVEKHIRERKKEAHQQLKLDF